MKEDHKKYLPIGSIVLLKNASKKIMVTGYFTVDPKNPQKVWEYCGYPFPEGVISMDILFMFDHSQIRELCHIGYEDDEEEKKYQKYLIDFNDKINNALRELEKQETKSE